MLARRRRHTMHSLHRTHVRRRGFTLAEMMVVIVILGLLATLVVPNVLGHYLEAARAKARADIAQLNTALNDYAIRNAGQYPDTLEALVMPDENGHAYLEARVLPLDPWKHAYVYEPPAPGSGEPRAHLVSWAQDGQPGGSDDLDNWGTNANR